MYAECFDKVLYHVNSRIFKCKMTNVITRLRRESTRVKDGEIKLKDVHERLQKISKDLDVL